MPTSRHQHRAKKTKPQPQYYTFPRLLPCNTATLQHQRQRNETEDQGANGNTDGSPRGRVRRCRRRSATRSTRCRCSTTGRLGSAGSELGRSPSWGCRTTRSTARCSARGRRGTTASTATGECPKASDLDGVPGGSPSVLRLVVGDVGKRSCRCQLDESGFGGRVRSTGAAS